MSAEKPPKSPAEEEFEKEKKKLQERDSSFQAAQDNLNEASLLSAMDQELGDKIEAEKIRKRLLENSESISVTPQEKPVPVKPEQILEQDISYQDTDLSDEQKTRMLEFNRTSESAKRYAESLADASGREDIKSIRDKARQMKEEMLSEANRLGIPVSPFGKSLAWAMWDIGKQNYFFTHPDENNSDYEIGDPLDSEEKQAEIVNRHLGWEAYTAFKGDANYQEKVQNDPKYTEALTLFQKESKENGTLSSKELAELGLLLRNIETEHAPESAETISNNSENTEEKGSKSSEGTTNSSEKKKQKKKWSEKIGKEKVASVAQLGAGLGAVAGVAGLGVWASAAFWGSLGVAPATTAAVGLSMAGIGAGLTFILGYAVLDAFAFTFAKNLLVDGYKWISGSVGKLMGGGGGGGGSKPAAKASGGGGHDAGHH